MTPQQFADRAVGVPWRRWRSDWHGMDCYGLIVLYWREVLGVDLGDVPQTDIAAGFAAAQDWHECGPEPGASAWMSFVDGAPTHCGVLLPGGMLLHAEGDVDRPGSVRVTRLVVIARLFPDLRFYRYAPRAAAC